MAAVQKLFQTELLNTNEPRRFPFAKPVPETADVKDPTSDLKKFTLFKNDSTPSVSAPAFPRQAGTIPAFDLAILQHVPAVIWTKPAADHTFHSKHPILIANDDNKEQQMFLASVGMIRSLHENQSNLTVRYCMTYQWVVESIYVEQP